MIDDNRSFVTLNAPNSTITISSALMIHDTPLSVVRGATKL